MAVYIGVDFGTRGIEIYQKDKGIILREPNVAAVDTKGNVVAVGSEALLIRGRAPGTVTIRRPLVNGDITDFGLAAEILDRCLEIAVPRVKKHVIAAAKYGFGGRSRELLTAALEDCRTGRVTLVDSALAALLGSGIESREDERESLSGNIVCDIGAGAVEASYIRAGELLRTETISGAGDASDAAIGAYIARKYGMAITANTAREAKHKLSLYAEDAIPLALTGLDSSTRMPKRVTVDSSELLQPCAPQIEGAVEAIETLLVNLPRNGASESTAERIVLVGGGAMLPGIGEYVSQKLGREVELAENPLDCTVLGLGMMLERES